MFSRLMTKNVLIQTSNIQWRVLFIACSAYIVTTAVNLQVPLYPIYANAAGFGSGIITLVFSCYVAGLLPVLIFLGGISDRVGRKTSILLGLGCALIATTIVIINPTLVTVAIARVFQGAGVGIAVGACTAFLAELLRGEDAPQRAAIYITATTSLGFGSGALFTSIFLPYQGTLTPLSYFIYIPIILIVFLTVVSVNEKSVVRKVAWIRLPYFKRDLLPHYLSIFFAWSVTGMVIAVVPSELALRDLLAWSGLTLFLVNGVGALCQPMARKMEALYALKLGLVLAPSGYLLLTLGVWLNSVWLILLGAAISGSACYGFTYLGGLASVSSATHQERSRAVSGYFLFAYLGFSLPVIFSGFLADWLGGMAGLLVFGGVVMLGNLAIYIGLKH